MNYVRRKGTKSARKLPAEFDDTKEAFLARIAEAVAELDIPDDMVINWDQTGVNNVPVGDWTLEEAGARQVPVIGLEDKRQITLLLAFSCLPRSSTKGRPTHATLALTSRRSGTCSTRRPTGQQRTHTALPAKLREANIRPVFVPASCTGELQPLDSEGCINDALKDLTKSFNFYAEKVAKTLENGTDIENVKVDLRLSAIKPLHANGLLGAMDRLAAETDVIGRGQGSGTPSRSENERHARRNAELAAAFRTLREKVSLCPSQRQTHLTILKAAINKISRLQNTLKRQNPDPASTVHKLLVFYRDDPHLTADPQCLMFISGVAVQETQTQAIKKIGGRKMGNSNLLKYRIGIILLNQIISGHTRLNDMNYIVNSECTSNTCEHCKKVETIDH
ncbi:hypothetical protein Bbelb_343660 [Branchiostoma belcheri]|nr:hypothetical protein Bbelb_343660 [Branchiostoma belcheri]